ncbi:MAG: NUDIX domain-containing protein [Jatrophihabitans sp.]
MSEPSIACASGIVFDARGRLLLVLRARPPAAGTWSVPGGKCEAGETAEQACVRELAEETALVVTAARWAGRVERPAPGGGVYLIDDFVCQVVSGTPMAGDDAAAVCWASRTELDALPLAPGLLNALVEWNLLPD